MDKKIKILITAIIILLLIGIGYKIVRIPFNEDKPVPDSDWLHDNCNCTERNNLQCPEGYTLDVRACIKNKTMTNAILKCSKYDCNGTIYEVEN